jgi:predicted TIM-barrel fold metal-dependent hydrolase
LPSIYRGYWDPFVQACADTATTICMHIGSSSRMPSTSTDAPATAAATLTFHNASASLTDWLLSGIFDRFPAVRIAYSEAQIGWVPYVLERIDDAWTQHQSWSAGGGGSHGDPPSQKYYSNVFTCFFRDRHGIASIDLVGEDNITFECDYPHADSTWPDTGEVAAELFRTLTDEQRYKVVRGNAARMLSLAEGG